MADSLIPIKFPFLTTAAYGQTDSQPTQLSAQPISQRVMRFLTPPPIHFKLIKTNYCIWSWSGTYASIAGIIVIIVIVMHESSLRILIFFFFAIHLQKYFMIIIVFIHQRLLRKFIYKNDKWKILLKQWIDEFGSNHMTITS